MYLESVVSRSVCWKLSVNRFVPGTASHCISGIDCIPIFVYHDSLERFSQWRASWTDQRFLEKNLQASCEPVRLETLTMVADKRLFAKICGQVQRHHCHLPRITVWNSVPRVTRLNYHVRAMTLVVKFCFTMILWVQIAFLVHCFSLCFFARTLLCVLNKDRVFLLSQTGT